MKHEVHRRLTDLASASDKEYGKLVQKLLAIAFCEAGATRVVERSIQGIDLEVTTSDGRNIALEVKTAQDEALSFGKKDLDGLARQAEDGLEPYFAVLGSKLLDEWIIARYFEDEIEPARKYRLTQLRPYRDTGLEDSIRAEFDDAVIKYSGLPDANRQGALDEVLRAYDCVSIA